MRVGLVILDGWGCNDAPQRDAVATADTPTMDRLTRAGYATELAVSGRRVRLPTGQMGNSEVGHLTIGAALHAPRSHRRRWEDLMRCIGARFIHELTARADDHRLRPS